MQVRSVPHFIDQDLMVFISDFTDNELEAILAARDNGEIERVMSLGKGKVLWFQDKSTALMFMLSNGKSIIHEEGVL